MTTCDWFVNLFCAGCINDPKCYFLYRRCSLNYIDSVIDLLKPCAVKKQQTNKNDSRNKRNTCLQTSRKQWNALHCKHKSSSSSSSTLFIITTMVSPLLYRSLNSRVTHPVACAVSLQNKIQMIRAWLYDLIWLFLRCLFFGSTVIAFN